MGKEDETLSLLRKLNKRGLRCVVVGEMAVVLYGVERATFDIDMAIGPTMDDVALLLDILSHLDYSEIINAETGEGITSIDDTHPDDIMEAKSVRVKTTQSIF